MHFRIHLPESATRIGVAEGITMGVDINQLEAAGVTDAQTAFRITDHEVSIRIRGAELHFDTVGGVGCLAWIHILTHLEHTGCSLAGSLVAARV